ncbi:hypothetical protein [Devosia sp. A449]
MQDNFDNRRAVAQPSHSHALAEGISLAGFDDRDGLWISAAIADKIPQRWQRYFVDTGRRDRNYILFSLPTEETKPE